METTPKETDAALEYKPRDYSLERLMIFLLSLLFFIPLVANGQEPVLTTTLDAVDGSALLLESGMTGRYIPVPAVSSDVHIAVAGPVIRTTVTQKFSNPTGRCVAGIYVYPLPETSAVDSLRMTIGSRVIEGEVREREEARREYEAARAEGRRSALVEQHRPNVFTTSVSTLLPGEEAIVRIEFQETARFEKGEYRLRFPMVVAPRFAPGPSEEPAPTASGTAGSTPSTPGPSTVRLTVDLQPGVSLRDIRSAHHRVEREALDGRRYKVTLADASVPSDRDFDLAWVPDAGTVPVASVLSESHGGDAYALVVVTPPAVSPARLPKETVFIVDTSGSMEGASMEQARHAVQLALDGLRPGDRFNIIDFDSEATALFERSAIADRDTIEDAKQFVGAMEAEGGTEMLKALRLALPEDDASSPGIVRQVIFITDGQVGNEQEVFSYLRSHLGGSRLFTVGIGNAPNSHFMRSAARAGRGTFTTIGDVAQVSERMAELFEKLDSPILTDLTVAAGDPSAEVWPSPIPDLYRGEPLTVALRGIKPGQTIRISGQAGDRKWQQEIAVPEPAASGIARLWGRQKIESIMDRLSDGDDPVRVREDVVAVALQHHLVSQFTSLVAVDRSAQGLTDAKCAGDVSVAEQTLGPDGQLPQTATPSAVLMLIGAGLILLAAAAEVWGRRGSSDPSDQ